MTGASEVVPNQISKTWSENLVSSAEPLRRAWNWLTQHSQGVLVRGTPRRLKVAETVSLGEKRFVSILQVDGEQFLVGGSPSNIVLLAKLEARKATVGARSFESVLSHVEVGVEGCEIDSTNTVGVTR